MTIRPLPGLPTSYGMMLWKGTRATKALIFVEEKPKRLSKLQGESQRLINQPVMKAAFLMGRRQKANFAAQRARPTTLQPHLSACRNFYEQGRYCSEREEV